VRGDASHAGLSGDSVLMLYPPWWPVGVLVHFRERSTNGDTLRGEASALVADGRVSVPTSRVMVIRVSCGAPASRDSSTTRATRAHAGGRLSVGRSPPSFGAGGAGGAGGRSPDAIAGGATAGGS